MRPSRVADARWKVGDCVVDLARHAVEDAAGKRIELRPQALDLLCLLAEQRGEVVGKRELSERLWPGMVVTDDSLVQAVGDARRAIGDHAHAAIQTVPRRGYRLIAEPAPESPGADRTSAGIPGRRASVAEWIRRHVSVLASVGLLLVAAAVGAVWRNAEQSRRPAADRPSQPVLAVLAFRDETRGSPDMFLGQGIAEELIADLASDLQTPVVSGRSSFAVDHGKLGVRETARQLRVRYLVDGSVRREGEELLVRTQLVEGETGRIVWTSDERAAVSQLAAVRTGLVRRLASTLHASVWQIEKQRMLAKPPSSLDAYSLAVRAYASKHVFTADAYRAGRADAERAVRLDPDYAFAWVVLGYLNSVDAQFRITGLWNAEGAQVRLAEALEQVDRGVRLDPRLALAYQARADVLLGLGRVQDALASIEMAVKLAPGDGDNLNLLAGVYLLSGRTGEAVATMDRVLPLYPVTPVYVNFLNSLVRWAARNYDAALASASECLVRVPTHQGCLISRAVILREMGRREEARQEADKFRALAPKARQSDLVQAFHQAPEIAARRLQAAEEFGFPVGP